MFETFSSDTPLGRVNSNLLSFWLPTLHLKYFGGCFLGWRWCNWNVYWHRPLKKKSGSTPEHYKWSSGRHVPLFKIIKLIKIMRTYEQYYWSLRCQEVIWSDYFHLISLCILINKTDLFFFRVEHASSIPLTNSQSGEKT